MTSPPPASPERPSSPWAVLVVMCAGYFLVLLDVTVVNVALPEIAAGLGAQVDRLQWVVDGYALALAALLLAGGTIGDLRGHKRVVLSGLVVFGAASGACGLAPDISVLIAARVAQGVGAALLLPGTLAIISRAFPGRSEQARAIGIWAAIGGMALPAGPLLGGAVIQTLGWRAVFLINVPIVVVAGLVAVRIVPRDHRMGSVGVRGLDRPGVVAAGLFLGTVTFAFIQAGHRGFDPVVAGAIVLAAILGLAFVAAERSRPEPMLPLGLFADRAFSTANVVAGVMNLGTLGLLFLLTLLGPSPPSWRCRPPEGAVGKGEGSWLRCCWESHEHTGI